MTLPTIHLEAPCMEARALVVCQSCLLLMCKCYHFNSSDGTLSNLRYQVTLLKPVLMCFICLSLCSALEQTVIALNRINLSIPTHHCRGVGESGVRYDLNAVTSLYTMMLIWFFLCITNTMMVARYLPPLPWWTECYDEIGAVDFGLCRSLMVGLQWRCHLPISSMAAYNYSYLAALCISV